MSQSEPSGLSSLGGDSGTTTLGEPDDFSSWGPSKLLPAPLLLIPHPAILKCFATNLSLLFLSYPHPVLYAYFGGVAETPTLMGFCAAHSPCCTCPQHISGLPSAFCSCACACTTVDSGSNTFLPKSPLTALPSNFSHILPDVRQRVFSSVLLTRSKIGSRGRCSQKTRAILRPSRYTWQAHCVCVS